MPLILLDSFYRLEDCEVRCVGPAARVPFTLIRGPNLPDHKFNLIVGEGPPILNDRPEAILRHLINNVAGFAASSVNGQPKCRWLLARNFGPPIAMCSNCPDRANER